VAFVWLYHGLVPKLLFAHPDEIAMLLSAGTPSELAPAVMRGIGIAEILLGLTVLVAFRARWPFLITVVLMIAALLGVGITAPSYLTAAFNPVSLNIAMIALASIGYVASAEVPFASRCLRQKPERTS
jgi:hypothetical protein